MEGERRRVVRARVRRVRRVRLRMLLPMEPMEEEMSSQSSQSSQRRGGDVFCNVPTCACCCGKNQLAT